MHVFQWDGTLNFFFKFNHRAPLSVHRILFFLYMCALMKNVYFCCRPTGVLLRTMANTIYITICGLPTVMPRARDEEKKNYIAMDSTHTHTHTPPVAAPQQSRHLIRQQSRDSSFLLPPSIPAISCVYVTCMVRRRHAALVAL